MLVYPQHYTKASSVLTVCAQVTQTQDATTIRNHNDLDITGPVVHHGRLGEKRTHSSENYGFDTIRMAASLYTHHGTPVRFGKVHTTRTAKAISKLLTNLTDSRRVNKRCHFFHIVDNDSMIERFIGIMKIFEQEILFNVRGLVIELGKELFRLLFNGHDARWHETSKTEAVALTRFKSKGDTFVKETIVHNVGTSTRDADGMVGSWCILGATADGIFERHGRLLIKGLGLRLQSERNFELIRMNSVLLLGLPLIETVSWFELERNGVEKGVLDNFVPPQQKKCEGGKDSFDFRIGRFAVPRNVT